MTRKDYLTTHSLPVSGIVVTFHLLGWIGLVSSWTKAGSILKSTFYHDTEKNGVHCHYHTLRVRMQQLLALSERH